MYAFKNFTKLFFSPTIVEKEKQKKNESSPTLELYIKFPLDRRTNIKESEVLDGLFNGYYDQPLSETMETVGKSWNRMFQLCAPGQTYNLLRYNPSTVNRTEKNKSIFVVTLNTGNNKVVADAIKNGEISKFILNGSSLYSLFKNKGKMVTASDESNCQLAYEK